MNSTVSPRRPWLAALLSLLQVGLGHMYSGQLTRALLFACIGLIINPLLIVLLLKTGMVIHAMISTLIVSVCFHAFVLVDAWRIAQRQGDQYQMKALNCMPVYFLFWLLVELGAWGGALSGAYAVRDTYEAFVIPNASMAPTIQAGDRVVVHKNVYLEQDPQVGDLVVFRPAEMRKAYWIKRVVATGGQTVAIQDGRLIIDGQPLVIRDGREENQGTEYTVSGMEADMPSFGPLAVPAFHVFVLGDNRVNSKDSRHFGPIPIASMIGKVEERFWPLNRTGPLNEIVED